MKNTLAAFAAFAALATSAATVRTATEAFVTNRITTATNALATSSAAAYMPQSNAYTKAETDEKISYLVDDLRDGVVVPNRAERADRAYVADAIQNESGSIELSADEISSRLDSSAAALAAVSNEAQVVYRLFSGSNVVDEVTNYNSQVRLPSRRLYQLGTNGYHMVWNEMDQHTNTLAQAKKYADDSGTNYAPKAWSRTTAMYGAEAPSNTTWISTPTTVIAAGYEYQKYATSGGAIWVLTSRGASYEFSPNTNNTAFLNIAAQDGTPIFRIEKTDSYLLGVNASAIEVENDTMYVDVNIAAASHPFVRVCAQLGDTWQKEEDGISASLATVNWSQTADGWRCAVANNTGGSSLFAYFEYLQEGGVKIVNGGVLDISGGLIVNGTTYTRIGTATISGHTVLTLEQ